MNVQIKRLGIFLVLCYLALFVKLNLVQVFQADELTDSPLNRRTVQREYNRPRGAITSADGALLAQSKDTDGESIKRIRSYPEKELFGQITGHFSFTFGATGVEKTYNDELSASTVQQQVLSLADLFSNKETVGNVQVSVRKDLQQEARDALGQREGSVVVLDPRTGEILAFWSYPSYDPNLLSGSDTLAMQGAWKLLNAAPDKPLQAKQYQERYFPGSTFKVVTGGVGLQTGKVTKDDPSYPVESSYTAKGTRTPLKNYGGELCGGTLFPILQISCNTAFARMGSETIGGQDMINGAGSFGFNQPVPIDLPSAATSRFPTDVVKDVPKLALASIGQSDVAATPLQMALVTAGVANKGVIMKPHVMRQVTDSDGRVVKTYAPEPWLTPMDEEHAGVMREAMIGVVTGGTGTPAQIPGVEVAGKTGTAQLGDGRVHTWMVSMAGPPGGVPEVVVAAVVLNQPAENEFTGGQVAGPIAKRMMVKTLQVMHTPAPAPSSTSPGAGGGTAGGAPAPGAPGGPTTVATIAPRRFGNP